jgi:hypothetical protein
MAKLRPQTVKNLLTAVASQEGGNEIATKLNQAALLADGATHRLVSVIIATNVSQTVDFGILRVGDQVAMIPATAGNADQIGPIAVAGTLGQAAIVGNMYLVFRSIVASLAAANSNVKF